MDRTQVITGPVFIPNHKSYITCYYFGQICSSSMLTCSAQNNATYKIIYNLTAQYSEFRTQLQYQKAKTGSNNDWSQTGPDIIGFSHWWVGKQTT